MILTWSKQFLKASALFMATASFVLISFSMKEKKVAAQVLEEAERTVRVSSESHFNLN